MESNCTRNLQNALPIGTAVVPMLPDGDTHLPHGVQLGLAWTLHGLGRCLKWICCNAHRSWWGPNLTLILPWALLLVPEEIQEGKGVEGFSFLSELNKAQCAFAWCALQLHKDLQDSTEREPLPKDNIHGDIIFHNKAHGFWYLSYGSKACPICTPYYVYVIPVGTALDPCWNLSFPECAYTIHIHKSIRHLQNTNGILLFLSGT